MDVPNPLGNPSHHRRDPRQIKERHLMYQFVINFLQPLGAVLLVTVGNIMILITGIGWLFTPKITEQLARMFMTTALTAMILIMAGVYIARW